MSIYIFSRPIQSGKTSELLEWCRLQKNVAGVLMPDIDGSRKILDLQTKAIFDIECTDVSNSNEALTPVGKFNFYTAAFERANAIIYTALREMPNWLVIDEAGKLELNGTGFYDSVVKAVEIYSSDKVSGNLLITVRGSLCEEVISFFNIKNVQVIHNLQNLI